jgi:hypothetical protein
MLNRRQRRAHAAQERKGIERADMLKLATYYLANIADSTATGATVVMPNGEMLYLSADDARALYGHQEMKDGAA